MKYKNLIFDLDGTLWDSRETIVDNWNQVLSKLNLISRPIVKTDMDKYMGLLIPDVLKDMFPGISENLIYQIMDEIRESENQSILVHGGILYESIEESLRKLAVDHNLFIVSNCQDGYIESFLKYFGFENLITDFESYGRTGKPKVENIKSVVDRNHLNSDETIYIGDTMTDYEAASQNNLDFIFCSYGFGRNNVNGKLLTINKFNELLQYI